MNFEETLSKNMESVKEAKTYQAKKTKAELLHEFDRYRHLLDSTAVNRYAKMDMSI